MVEPAPAAPDPWLKILRWIAVASSGPLVVFWLLRVDWGFLPEGSPLLDLSPELLVGELVASYRLTLACLISLLVFRLLLRPRRSGRAAAAQLPFYFWGLEAAAFGSVVLYSTGHGNAGWMLFTIWLQGIVTFSVLTLVVLSAVLHLSERDSSHGAKKRWIARVGIAPVLSVKLVVLTVVMDWLLVSLVMSRAIQEQIVR